MPKIRNQIPSANDVCSCYYFSGNETAPENECQKRFGSDFFSFFFLQKTFFSKDLLVPINRALNAPGREEMQGHSMITVKVVIFC